MRNGDAMEEGKKILDQERSSGYHDRNLERVIMRKKNIIFIDENRRLQKLLYR